MKKIKAIKNAQIVTERGIIWDGVIIVENDKIKGFGSFRDINIPETIGIALAVLIATIVSTASEYGSAIAFEKLCSASSSVYSVRRNGVIISIAPGDIVVGDIILLSSGEKIPAAQDLYFPPPPRCAADRPLRVYHPATGFERPALTPLS